MKTLRLIPFLCMTLLVPLFLTGCGEDLFETTPGGVTVLTEDSLKVGEQYIALSEIPASQHNSLRLARLVIPKGTQVEVSPGQVQVNAEVQQSLGIVQALPIPYAAELGWGLSSLLSIGAVFLNAKRKRAVAGRQAVVAGNDVFLDGIQQTPLGPIIEQMLISAQVETQKRAKVQADIDRDLMTVRTPDKPTHTEVTPELVAALKKSGALK